MYLLLVCKYLKYVTDLYFKVTYYINFCFVKCYLLVYLKNNLEKKNKKVKIRKMIVVYQCFLINLM